MQLAVGANRKRIVVTGASRGIGRAIALACGREGAVVGINFRSRQAEAQALKDEIAGRYGTTAHLLPFDVTDPDAVAGGVRAFLQHEGRLDGWVNNAAVISPGLLATADPEQIRAQVDVNLLGPLFSVRAVLPAMLAQRSGVFVNVSSVAAAAPSRGQAVYAATKGALESLTRALSVEYGRKGIRAVCVRPGPADTDMLRATRQLGEEEILGHLALHRIAAPEEIAELVVFLLSDRAAYVTGSVHAIDGGYA